jgi:hypothetical protein
VTVRIIETTEFDPNAYADELAAARTNMDVGTRMWFENDAIRVWEVRLAPGMRGPFHAHTRHYFWTVVDAGVGRQRTKKDGSMITREYNVGDTNYSEHSADDPMIHDFENVGETDIRFITVELLD